MLRPPAPAFAYPGQESVRLFVYTPRRGEGISFDLQSIAKNLGWVQILLPQPMKAVYFQRVKRISLFFRSGDLNRPVTGTVNNGFKARSGRCFWTQDLGMSPEIRFFAHIRRIRVCREPDPSHGQHLPTPRFEKFLPVLLPMPRSQTSSRQPRNRE